MLKYLSCTPTIDIHTKIVGQYTCSSVGILDSAGFCRCELLGFYVVEEEPIGDF